MSWLTELAPTQWRLGAFQVALDRNSSALSVANASSSKVIWSTVVGEPAVLAAKAHDKVTGDSGCFMITQRDKDLCPAGLGQAHVDQPTPRSLTVEGAFDGCASASGMGWRLQLYAPPDSIALQFNLTLRNVTHGYDRVFLRYSRASSERFYGFGQQFTLLDARGSLVPVFTREQGIGRGLQPITSLLNAFGREAGGDERTTYSAVPHYLTSHRRALHLLNTEPCWFDLRTEGAVTVEMAGTSLSGRVFGAESALQLVERASIFTGRMRPLPDWAHAGAVVGVQGGSSRVAQLADRMLAANVSLAAV